MTNHSRDRSDTSAASGEAAAPSATRGTKPDAVCARRMAQFGRLVGPVASEIRNPVSILMASSEMLARELGPQHGAAGLAYLIGQTSERIFDAVVDLAALALPLHFERATVDLGRAVSDCVEEYSLEACRLGVRIIVDLPDLHARVQADPFALELAVRRVFHRALASMPGGGELRIALVTPEAQDRLVSVRFTDTGEPAPANQVSNILEPASVPGRRAGLAMAACRQIVEAMGGRLAVRNAPEGGIAVEMSLPRAQ